MKTVTRLCDLKDVERSLRKLVAPAISPGERVLLCAETTTEYNRELKTWTVLVLTERHLYHADKDNLRKDGFSQVIPLQYITRLEKDVRENGDPILVIKQYGELFAAVCFASQSSFDTFVDALHRAGVALQY